MHYAIKEREPGKKKWHTRYIKYCHKISAKSSLVEYKKSFPYKEFKIVKEYRGSPHCLRRIKDEYLMK